MHKTPLKIRLRLAWAQLLDNLRDLANMAWPIFTVAGIITASFKFWLWALS